MPTVKLATWPMRCELFDGDLLDGPVPTLFTEDAEAAKNAISTAPEKAHWDIQKMLRSFILPEHVTVVEAAKIVKKPR